MALSSTPPNVKSDLHMTRQKEILSTTPTQLVSLWPQLGGLSLKSPTFMRWLRLINCLRPLIATEFPV